MRVPVSYLCRSLLGPRLVALASSVALWLHLVLSSSGMLASRRSRAPEILSSLSS